MEPGILRLVGSYVKLGGKPVHLIKDLSDNYMGKSTSQATQKYVGARHGVQLHGRDPSQQEHTATVLVEMQSGQTL